MYQMSTNVTKYGFNMREEDRYSQRQQVATSGQPCEGDEKMKEKKMRGRGGQRGSRKNRHRGESKLKKP